MCVVKSVVCVFVCVCGLGFTSCLCLFVCLFVCFCWPCASVLTSHLWILLPAFVYFPSIFCSHLFTRQSRDQLLKVFIPGLLAFSSLSLWSSVSVIQHAHHISDHKEAGWPRQGESSLGDLHWLVCWPDQTSVMICINRDNV